MLLQEQLSQDHPGRLQETYNEKAWWLIQRHHRDQPSSWIGESSGVMHHAGSVVEVYHVEIEENIEEADHVKTNEETIVPGY